MRALLQQLTRDHHRTLALIAAAQRELSLPGSPRSLTELGRRLRAHLRLEEELIFGAVEALVGDPGFHVTATLRREHQALRALFADVEAELARDNRAGAWGNLRELATSLAVHERKEHDVLFPMAERLPEPVHCEMARAELAVDPSLGVALLH
jgi:iron-sulfur cluster repair protein YtfE (RIC family)